MKKILEVANMKIPINIDEKEKSINKIINQVMNELENNTPSSTLSQLKRLLLGKPFNTIAMAGLTAIIVLTPKVTSSGLIITNPISSMPGITQTPDDSDNGANEGITDEDNDQDIIIEGSTATESSTSSTTSATFKLKSEFIPSNSNKVTLYNGNQFVKTILENDLNNGELSISGLAPNTTYDNFFLEREENGVSSLFFKVSFSKNTANVSMEKKLPLDTITTKSDPTLEDALQDALSRTENGEHIQSGEHYKENSIYLQGDRIIYQENEYEAMWWTSKAPSDTNLAWKLISIEKGISGEDIYNDTTIYEEGHMVEIQNEDGSADIYSANFWTRGETPKGSSSNWTYIKTISTDGTESTLREWDETSIYKRGDIVTYKGAMYFANWWNQKNIPEFSEAWTYISSKDSDENDILNWNKEQIYLKDAIVHYNGKNYLAKWWTRGNYPDVSNDWELIMEVSDSPDDDIEDEVSIEWSSTKIYLTGEIITYKGINFISRWNNQNKTPGIAEDWKIIPEEGTIYEWIETYSYITGDTVVYGGKTYIASYWTKGNIPGQSSAWKLLETTA